MNSKPLRQACFSVLAVALLTTGCSTSKIGFLATAIVHPTRPQAVELDDGYKADYYTFTLGDKRATDTYLFFVTGSGHASVQFCRHYLRHFPGNVRVFALQKRFVSHWTTGLFEPPDGFVEHHCLSSWTSDQIEFVKYILSESDADVGRIVVFGVSEGSAVAAAVAAAIPQITHLVSLGDGGMKGIDAFRRCAWGKEQGIDFDQIFRLVSEEPSTEKRIGYQSYKWWKETLEMDPMQSLQSLDIPLLFAMGEKDRMAPVESLYYLRNEFERRKKHNLTVKVYADCNHVLLDSRGMSHRREFFDSIGNWLEKRSQTTKSTPSTGVTPSAPSDER